MAHLPVDHPLRPLYRTLAALIGLYVLVFGVIGVAQTSGSPLFDQATPHRVLGLRTNLAFAWLSLVCGLVILVAWMFGRNVDRLVFLVGGIVFMSVGMLMLGLLRTSANFLSFSMVNCVVSFLFGLVFFAAGLYGRTGSGAVRQGQVQQAGRPH